MLQENNEIIRITHSSEVIATRDVVFVLPKKNLLDLETAERGLLRLHTIGKLHTIGNIKLHT